MPGGGTRTFLEPDHYEASLRQAQIESVIVPRGKFRARLTWAELHHLQVLRCEEDSARIGYVQLAPGLAFVAFPADSEPLPVWRGTEIQPGKIMIHGRGERLHQSTSGPAVRNVIAIDPAQLERYGWALSGAPFSLPAEGRTLQPSRRLATGLRRLHARICSFAETKPKILSHCEVARAMEQGLIQMLVTCLTNVGDRLIWINSPERVLNHYRLSGRSISPNPRLSRSRSPSPPLWLQREALTKGGYDGHLSGAFRGTSARLRLLRPGGT